MKEVNHVISAIEKCRSELSDTDEWFMEASNLSKNVNAPEPSIRPRLTKYQQHRANTPADSPQTYYKRTISIPFVDHLLSELKSRFSTIQQRSVNGFALIPDMFVSDPDVHKVEIHNYADLMIDDLPFPHSLTTEIECWQSKWIAKMPADIPTTLTATLKATSPHMYPNIHTMLRLCATVPVTSCECERSFSRLKILKTYLRSTMRQDRLSGLALMSIHREIKIDTNDIINRFARANQRRMELII